MDGKSIILATVYLVINWWIWLKVANSLWNMLHTVLWTFSSPCSHYSPTSPPQTERFYNSTSLGPKEGTTLRMWVYYMHVLGTDLTPSQRHQFEVGIQTDSPELDMLIPAGITVGETHGQDICKCCHTESDLGEIKVKCRKECADWSKWRPESRRVGTRRLPQTGDVCRILESNAALVMNKNTCECSWIWSCWAFPMAQKLKEQTKWSRWWQQTDFETKQTEYHRCLDSHQEQASSSGHILCSAA